jgi:hypothetical protein
MGTQVQQVTQTTSNIGAAQLPYYNTLMQGAQGLLGTQMPIYDRERIEGFTPQQKALQGQIAGLQTPAQFGNASQIAELAGLNSLSAGQYTPGQFNFNPVQNQQVNAPTMQSAQTSYRPDLQYFQMQGPQQFGGRQAAQYMSPFIQQALEPQMREAVLSAKRGQLAQDLGAARQGTYGGSRQLLASMERERNLGQQMGDIQSRGLQAAYESAQQQFERDRAAQLQTGQTNLQAALQTQGLGAQYGTQIALANLSNEQQARVNNQALQFQAQGMNAENALRAALANQQAGMETQRMGEQSRQFGSQQGLAGLAQAGQMAQTLGNLGQYQQNADLARFGLQQGTAAQEQALNQQMRDLDYQDFLRESEYPYTQLQRYGNLLSGVPQATTATATTTAPAPSVAQQLLGTGLGALGMYKTITG